MSELKEIYIIQGVPTMMAEGYKSLGFEDIGKASSAEEAYFMFKKAEKEGNYSKVRVVKLCAFKVVEL